MFRRTVQSFIVVETGYRLYSVVYMQDSRVQLNAGATRVVYFTQQRLILWCLERWRRGCDVQGSGITQTAHCTHSQAKCGGDLLAQPNHVKGPRFQRFQMQNMPKIPKAHTRVIGQQSLTSANSSHRQ